MDKFNFIPVFLSKLFTNTGLYQIYVFIIACFGIQILYKLVAGWITNKWHY